MALTNFKNNVNKPTDDDEFKRLLCSVPGCGKRWSIQIDKPMCSFHQWGKSETKHEFPRAAPQKPFVEVGDVF